MALPKRIEFTDEGRKSLGKFSYEVRRKVLKKITEYNQKPDLIAAHIKQLTDTNPPRTRLKIGRDHRCIGSTAGDTPYLSVIIDRKDL